MIVDVLVRVLLSTHERGVGRAGIKKKNTVSEHAITRRIFGIFDRALRRFPGDVNLWKQYLDMARSSRSYKAVSRIFGRYVAVPVCKSVCMCECGACAQAPARSSE